MEVYSIIEGAGNFHHSSELRVHIVPIYMSVDGGGLVGKDSMRQVGSELTWEHWHLGPCSDFR